MNPASMFVGFISPKEFFSVINRKHVENHKLNLFDVDIDPLEFKLGFGNQSNGETEQDLDNYFAYCVAANLNGYVFYSPANLANAITLLASTYFKEPLEEMPDHFFVQSLFATYLLSYSLVARIKVFPEGDEHTRFNWFIELFFNFYKITFQQLDTKVSKTSFEEAKKKLLNQTSFFFLLFHFYQKMNSLLIGANDDLSHLNWLFGLNPKEKLIQAFKSNYQSSKHIANFSPLEQSIMANIWPSDILIKYLLGPSDPFIVVETIVSKIFPKNEVDPLVQSFLKGGERLGELFDYLLETKKYKHGFFAGVQNYMIRLFRAEGKEEVLEEIDEMLSAIDNGDDINPFDIPERLKRESKVTERLLNFYVILLGGFSNARGDNFYLRFNKPKLIDFFAGEAFASMISTQTAIDHIQNLNLQYQKGRFYYEYINDQLRNGTKKLTVLVDSMPEDLNHNPGVLRLYCQGMAAAFFQDFNQKEIKLTIKNPHMIDLFRAKYGKTISEWVKKEKSDFLRAFYAPMANIWGNQDSTFFTLLEQEVNASDLGNLKDALYRLDFWINYSMMQAVEKVDFIKHYGKSLTVSIFGTMRESLFGLLLLLHSLKKQPKLDSIIEPMLIDFYLREILGVGAKGFGNFTSAITKVSEECSQFFDLWISLDDNEEFLQLIGKSITNFIKKHKKKAPSLFTGDDVIWFRGLLKNITYYNKRFVIPE